MKKKIAATIMAVVCTLALTACGSFTCNICGQEKSGKSYTEEVLGQKVVICKDCYDQLNAGLNALTNLFN